MRREFDRNLFIMLFAIMIGAIIITYFAADIVKQSKIENLEGQIASKDAQIQSKEKEIIEEKNRSIDFTNSFLVGMNELDRAREDRSNGYLHFDSARLFFSLALSEENDSKFDSYKNKVMNNCSKAMPEYVVSRNNFLNAGFWFNSSKNFTEHNSLLKLLNSYINLSDSGAELAMLLYDASDYLYRLAFNLSIKDGNISYHGNFTELWTLYNETVDVIEDSEDQYQKERDSIQESSGINDDEYDFDFRTVREP